MKSSQKSSKSQSPQKSCNLSSKVAKFAIYRQIWQHWTWVSPSQQNLWTTWKLSDDEKNVSALFMSLEQLTLGWGVWKVWCDDDDHAGWQLMMTKLDSIFFVCFLLSWHFSSLYKHLLPLKTLGPSLECNLFAVSSLYSPLLFLYPLSSQCLFLVSVNIYFLIFFFGAPGFILETILFDWEWFEGPGFMNLFLKLQLLWQELDDWKEMTNSNGRMNRFCCDSLLNCDCTFLCLLVPVEVCLGQESQLLQQHNSSSSLWQWICSPEQQK